MVSLSLRYGERTMGKNKSEGQIPSLVSLHVVPQTVWEYRDWESRELIREFLMFTLTEGICMCLKRDENSPTPTMYSPLQQAAGHEEQFWGSCYLLSAILPYHK